MPNRIPSNLFAVGLTQQEKRKHETVDVNGGSFKVR